MLNGFISALLCSIHRAPFRNRKVRFKYVWKHRMEPCIPLLDIKVLMIDKIGWHSTIFAEKYR